ncbi:MAG TPA: copper homeostasis protein CutC, partial [Rudaea sp.]
SLDDVVALGCERVLTSGAQPTALAGAPLLRELILRADGHLVVMPGGGIDAGGLVALARRTGATEFHASAKRTLPSAPAVRRLDGMTEGEARTDVELVRALVAAAELAATSA